MYSRIIYAAMGAFFLLMGLFMFFVAYMAGSPPVPQSYLIFAIAIMSFCFLFHYPARCIYFRAADEVKSRRNRGRC